MNGQLNEQPVAELIREIGSKSLSGRLRLQQEKIKVATYFKSGAFLYAASNVRALRLREYLLKSNVVPESQLARIEDRGSDIELASSLCDKKLLTTEDAELLQSKLVTDILRLVLLWTEGTWEFDHRFQLTEELNLSIDTQSLLLETGRRFPGDFIGSRFLNPVETLTPSPNPSTTISLTPTEVFLMSRVDQPMALNDVIALSGISEPDALRVIYSLGLAGLLQREHWKRAFRDGAPAKTAAKPTKPEPPKQPTPIEEPPPPPQNDISIFLERLDQATSHYEVLGVQQNSPAADIKTAYYQLAKNYHPDRYRREEPETQTRIESAFARVTQAYDTLRDAGQRATYDSKLDARAKARQLADNAPRATASIPVTQPPPEKVENKEREPAVNTAQNAEQLFKEGFAALELGQRNTAVGLLGAAARAVPNEARYRAYYGRALSSQENTRRLAEAELLAALKIDPGNAQYRTMLAELYRDLGFMLRAKAEAERAVAADSNNQKARELLRTLK